MWALDKHTGVDRDATRLRDKAPKVRPLIDDSVLITRLAHYHAIARISYVAADHTGSVQRSVITKARIERAKNTTRIGLQTIQDCSLLSLDVETPSNTISRQSFRSELYKSHDLHPIIPLVY
jgi:hypothetical protein